MAKKNNQGEDIFQTIIFAAIAVVAAVFFLLKIAVSIATYLFPFVAIGVYLAYEQVGDTPPVIPDAGPFDRPDIAAEVGGLIQSRIEKEQLIQTCYAAGEADGIMLTKASDYTRFAERGRKGKDLNATIDRAERDIDTLRKAIDYNKGLVWNSFPSWLSAHSEWAQKRAGKLAVRNAVVIAIGVTLLCYLLAVLPGSTFFRNLQEAALFAPPFLLSPVACGALCGYGAFFLIRRSKAAELEQQMDPDKYEGWRLLQDKWRWYSDDEPFISPADTGAHSDHRQASTSPSWCAVLGVTPDASPDDIRKAFYAARKKYNPDIAATKGEDIQQLANEKSKEINLAYEEARAAKGF